MMNFSVCRALIGVMLVLARSIYITGHTGDIVKVLNDSDEFSTI